MFDNNLCCLVGSIVDFDNGVALLAASFVPLESGIINEGWSDAHHRLQSLKLDVIHAGHGDKTILDLHNLVAALVLSHLGEELLVLGEGGKVRIGCNLGRNVAVEGISVFVVETLDTNDTVVNEHTEKKEEETAELEVRPVVPELSEIGVLVGDGSVAVVDDHVSDPDTGATETLKDGTKNSRGVAGHEHTKEVIAKDNGGIEDTEAKDVTVVEKHVESIESVLTTVLQRDERSEAEEDGANESTPHTLKTDNKNGVEADVLQKMLLNDNLGSLDDLSENDESATKSNLSSGGGTFFAGGRGGRRHGARGGGGGSLNVGPGRLVKSGESDNNEGESDETDTTPVRGVELTLEEELGEKSREDNHGTTKHLPDRSRNPKKTDVHHSSSAHIAKSRSAHKAVLLPNGHLMGFLLPGAVRINKRLRLRKISSFLLLLALDTTHDLIHNKATKHTDEHSLSLEPWLLELVFVTSIIIDTIHRKDKLLDNNGAGTEGKHTCNNNSCHITHLYILLYNTNNNF